LVSSPYPIILCLNRFPDDPEWQNRDRVFFSLAETSWLDGQQNILLDRIAAVVRENCGAGATDPSLKQARRGKTRSAWLDQQITIKQWSSDTDIVDHRGPTYNTIRRYRSGKESTRDAYVRGRLARAFGVLIKEVPR